MTEVTARTTNRRFAARITTLVLWCAFAAVSLAAVNPVLKEADELLARKKYAEAAEAYEKLALDPKLDKALAAEALFQVGVCRLKDNRQSEAFTVWSRLRVMFPDSPQAAQSLVQEAQSTTNTLRARMLTEEILTKHPASPEAATLLLQRGQVAFDRQDYAAAITNWEAFVQQFPKHGLARETGKKLEVAKLAASGERDATIAEDVEAAMRRADGLFDRAAFEEAAKIYREVVEKYSTTSRAPEAAVRLARCQMSLGRRAEAVTTLQRMAGRPVTGGAKVLAELVVQCAGVRDLDKTRESATQLLLHQSPEAFETQQALFIAGSVAMSRRDKTEALKRWQLLLDRYPQTEFRAAVEKELNRTEPVIALAKPAPAKPKQPTASELAAQREQRRKAQEVEARRLDAAWHLAWASMEQRADTAYELAHAYVELGKHNEAARAYQWIWQQMQQSPHADDAVFEAAQDCLCTGDEQKATEHLSYLINKYSDSPLRPMALYGLGNREILYHANPDGAWPYYQQLFQEYPQHVLAERARTFWAAVVKLPRPKLKDQVADFLKHQKRKSLA